MDDYEADEPGKYIGSGDGGSSRSHKLAELQQEIVEQLSRIADRVEARKKAKKGGSSDSPASRTSEPVASPASDSDPPIEPVSDPQTEPASDPQTEPVVPDAATPQEK